MSTSLNAGSTGPPSPKLRPVALSPLEIQAITSVPATHQHTSMPAKIRSIKGKIKPEDHFTLIQPLGEDSVKSIGNFEFNKSLNYKGGTSGEFIITRLGPDKVRFKVKQDLNDDGNFSKDELIYTGKVKGVDDAESLLNFEGKIKIKKQMHNCDWDIQKNPENLICTRDYVPELTDIMLVHNDGEIFNFPVYSPIGLLGGALF